MKSKEENIMSMPISHQIDLLIKKLNIKKVEFARALKIDQSYVTRLIKGDNIPSDRLIDDICREFGVNEIWLRTGEGGDENMFTKISEDDRYSLNLGKLSSTQNENVKNMVNAIAETDPEKLKVIEEFMKACLGIK